MSAPAHPIAVAAGRGLPPAALDRRYLVSMTLGDYLDLMAEHHPWVLELVDMRTSASVAELGALATRTTEFDSDTTGRGDSYRSAQQVPVVRWTGMRQLLRLVAPAGRPATVLDVLGGDGTIARALAGVGMPDLGHVRMLTSDNSAAMIQAALGRGLPAVRQDAEQLFLREGSVDGALLAYGSHHITPGRRARVLAELARVVRPGGWVVVHDFDEAGPMARFFREVVHVHARAGHDYTHFTPAALGRVFRAAGLTPRVGEIYDPFVVPGATPDEARQAMCDYVGAMYGVRAYLESMPPAGRWAVLERHFDYRGHPGLPSSATAVPTVRRQGDSYAAEVPRLAIVGAAQR